MEGNGEAIDGLRAQRRAVSREEICPYLWGELERAVDQGYIDLAEIKKHLVYCERCLPEFFGSLDQAVDGSTLNAGEKFIARQLVARLRSTADKVRAEARAMVRDPALIMPEGSDDAEG